MRSSGSGSGVRQLLRAGLKTAELPAREVFTTVHAFVVIVLVALPDVVRGTALTLVLAGLLSLAFMGFAGLGG